MEQILYAFEWIELFCVLSLDCVRPFYRHMGLRLGSPEIFRDRVRLFLRDHTEALSDWPEKEDLGRTQVAAVQVLLDELKETLGRQCQRVFCRWAMTRSAGIDQDRAWLPHDFVLLRWTVKRRATGEDPMGATIGGLLEPLYQEYRRRFDLDREFAAARSIPLSPWDQWMYDVRRYTNDLERMKEVNAPLDYMGLRDPYVTVEDYAQRDAFHDMWMAVLTQLDPGAIGLLHSFINQQLEREGKKDAVVGNLNQLTDSLSWDACRSEMT